jgi:hypothetical protein
MEIKRYNRIEWNDLPRIETPFLACVEVRDHFPASPWSLPIRGMDKALEEYRHSRLTPVEDYRKECDWLVERVEDGQFVLILHDGEWEHPLCSALRWRTKNNPDGFHIPNSNDRIAWLSLPPEGHWIADFWLPMLLRSQIERCLEEGRHDASCHRGLPERLWWNLWQQGRGKGSGGQNGGGGRSSAERSWYARAWDEARRVGEDTVQEVAETARTAWEALPFTADEAATKAARERIVDSVAGTFDGMATLVGPSAEEILQAHETGDPDAIAMVEQRQQEQREAAKALGDGVRDALGEVYERSGAAGVAGAAGATVAIGVAGGKGAGALGKAAGKLGGARTPQVTSVADGVETVIEPKQLPPLRQAYVDEVNALGDAGRDMHAKGIPPEQIARKLHQMRRELGVKYKDLTPETMREEIYARNLQKYGDKLGPSVDWLKARGKSWEQIIESASRSGGKDLGF